MSEWKTPITIHLSSFTAARERRQKIASEAQTRALRVVVQRCAEQSSGDHSAVAPPVPIPNTEVKRCSPDGSACIACARVGRRQNLCPVSWKQGAGLFVCLDIEPEIFGVMNRSASDQALR